MNATKAVRIWKGGTYSDERGRLSFVNELSLLGVKRFYTILHPSTYVIRAWQGHRCEAKYFFPLRGRFLIAWTKIDDFANPSNELRAEYHILDDADREIVHIPGGYANGLKALKNGSELLVLSSMSLEESQGDIVSYDKDRWFDWKSV